ncbi:peptidoglycan-binding domain-containing protein [Lacibacterium aquatile]|uniref:Peptidoglycan-binding domain-containing protein n=1 Tax=Lacibacterium aquatile TaxID=1168082 RepID=A0ABW5DV69_9PROT
MIATRLLLSSLMAATLLATPVLAQSKDEVEEAQKILMLMGKFSNRPTGEMTDNTRKGITDFQREAKLPQTGKLDGQTLNALREVRDTKYSKGLSLPTAQQQQQARTQAALPPPKPVAVPQAKVDSEEFGGSAQTLTGYGQRSSGSSGGPTLTAPQMSAGSQQQQTQNYTSPQNRALNNPNLPPPISRPNGVNPPAVPREQVTAEHMYSAPSANFPAAKAEEEGISRFWPWLAAGLMVAIAGWIVWRGFVSSGASANNPYFVGSAAANLGTKRREPTF